MNCNRNLEVAHAQFLQVRAIPKPAKIGSGGLNLRKKLREMALKLSAWLEICPLEYAEDERTSHSALAASQRARTVGGKC
jgi:hypothetical protein